MAVVPPNTVEKIEFYETHIEPWTERAAEIGTSSGEVTELASLTVAAREAHLAQAEAQQAARAATLNLQMAMEAMGAKGASIMKQIRAKASQTGEEVYSLASIPAPAQQSPIAEPGTPTNFKIQLNQEGSLELKWKCANPAGAVGTMYHVYRRVEGDESTPFEYLGSAGERKFLDITLPPGVPAVQYRIQAVRSTKAGGWANFSVNFGVNSSMKRMMAMVMKTYAKKQMNVAA